MCATCWAYVSPATQREVYRTVKLRDMRAVDETWAPWWRASHQAIYEVAVAQGLDGRENMDGQPWSAARWLAHEERVADELEFDDAAKVDKAERMLTAYYHPLGFGVPPDVREQARALLRRENTERLFDKEAKK